MKVQIQFKTTPLAWPQSQEETWNEARDREERPFQILKVLLIEIPGISHQKQSLSVFGKKDLFNLYEPPAWAYVALFHTAWLK